MTSPVVFLMSVSDIQAKPKEAQLELMKYIQQCESLRAENAKMLDLLRIVRAMPHSHEAIRKVVQFVDSRIVEIAPENGHVVTVTYSGDHGLD